MTPTPHDDTPPDLIPADDPVLQDLVARALAPYAAHVSPAVLVDMRAQLIVTLTTHPNCAPIIDRARRAAPRIERSGTREKPGAPAVLAAQPKKGRGR